MTDQDSKVSVRLLQAHTQRLQDRLKALESLTEQQGAALQQTSEVSRAGAAVMRIFCRSPVLDEALDGLRSYLRQYFDAQYSALYLFTDRPLAAVGAQLQIKPRQHAARRLFLALFEHDLPLCDSLQDEHLSLLLGSAKDAVRATVLIPASHPQLDALMFLGSGIPDRYRSGPALDFLVGLHATVVAISYMRLALEQRPAGIASCC